MSEELTARFAMSYRKGPTIEGDFHLPLGRRHVISLCGPSGGGKTTVLRCLAGLEHPVAGFIQAGEEIWFDAARSICLGPQKREVGFLFQDYALFPHLTVAGNIAFGLGHLARADRREKVEELLERFELSGLGARRPGEISGGQQQRVALARTLARRPRLLLLDEPLCALDTGLREALRVELKVILSDLDIPVILVTHDPEEAQALADEVVAFPMETGSG